jgi:hypothetical protein
MFYDATVVFGAVGKVYAFDLVFSRTSPMWIQFSLMQCVLAPANSRTTCCIWFAECSAI